MSNQLLSSKIVIEEEEPRIRSVAALPTAVVAALGVTQKGPFEPTLVTSYNEFVSKYGGFTADADLALFAQAFFENGGQFLYVKRIVHLTDSADADTRASAAASVTLQTPSTAAFAGSLTASNSAPFDLEPGDTLIFDVDGGGNDTATFDAAAATITAGSTGTYALSNGQTLTVEIDGGAVQTVSFLTAEFASIGAATATEVAAVINAKLSGAFADVNSNAVRITSDLRGTDSSVEVTGGTANSALGFSTTIVNGTGDVANIDAVTYTEIKTVVEADVSGLTVTDAGSGTPVFSSNTTGASSTIQCVASSTADDELGLSNAVQSGGTGAPEDTLTVNGKYEGAYGNSLTVDITDATSGTSTEFNLVVSSGGTVVEVYPNLTMSTTAANYALTVVNDADTGSEYISLADESASIPAPGNRPANQTGTALSGGDDGISGLVDADFTGNQAGGTGLYSLDTVNDLTMLAIPGQATSAIHNAMLTYCESHRDKSMFAVLDPPAAQTAAQMVTYVETTASLLNASEFGAIFWPQVKVANPSVAVFGNSTTITVAPSGYVCGAIARTDASREGGVYQPPAGIERGVLVGVRGFETDEVLDEAKRDLVYPKRINPLTKFTGARPHIDGTKTLKGDGNFPGIAERRGVIYIEQSIKRALQFARHSNNTPELRSAVERTVEAFLLNQMNVGAFRTSDPSTAFTVDFGDGLNPPSVQFAGKLIGRIGLATNKAIDFIILKFSQDVRAFEEELAQAGL